MSDREWLGKKISSLSSPTPSPLQARRLKVPVQAQSESQQQNQPSVQEQLERASHFHPNFLELPVHAPGTPPPPPPIQPKLAFRGLTNRGQQPGVPEINEVGSQDNSSLGQEQTLQRISTNAPDGQDAEGSSQRQEEIPQVQAKKEKVPPSGYNLLEFPVYAPDTSPSIQRQVHFPRLGDRWQQPSVSEVDPETNQGQRLQPFSRLQRVEYPPITEGEAIQKKGIADGVGMIAAPPVEEVIEEKPRNGQELEPLEAKTLAQQTTEVTSNKELPLPVEAGASPSLEAKNLGDRFREVYPQQKNTQLSNAKSSSPKSVSQIATSTLTQKAPTDTSQGVNENQLAETVTEKDKEQKAEAPAESQVAKSESTGSSESPPTQPPGQPATKSTGFANGFGGVASGQASASVPQEAVAIIAEDPAQILAQLKTTPPTQAVATYAQAQAASTQALEKQRQNLQKTIPEIPAPTGLPAQPETESQKAAKQALEQAGTTKEPSDVKAGLNKSSEPGTKYDPQVPEAPPPKPQTATQLAGGNVEKEGESDPALSQSAQNALASVNLDTSQVSTNAGERPNVDLAGEADPAQINAAQSESNQEVQAAKAQAAAGMNQDFGENKIYPAASQETLKANKELSAVTAPVGKLGENPALPGEVVGSLNQSLSPFLREKIGAEQEKYQAAKDKFDIDSAKARTEADNEITGLNEETKQKQLEEQKQAQAEVQGFKQEWAHELDIADKDYQEKAGKATQEQREKIGQEKSKGEKEAAKHLEDAEKKAEEEKQKADSEVGKKKEDAEKESGGFWGWVKSKAKALIDGLKSAVNFIYDNLRKAVKAIFEAAKKLALAAIDLARQAIVGLIKGFGEILKGLVKVVFAAFPGIAKKITDKIDQAVNKATKAVNAAADLLKKGVSAILDFLANTLDTLLKLVQDIYNGIFTVIGMLINGEFAALLKRIGNLIEAAKAAPPQFETAGYEELLGGNLDQPLSPAELAQAGVTPPGAGGGSTPQMGEASELPSPPWTEKNVGVDAVENNMELSPELSAELMQQTQGEGEVMLEQSNDESRSMESILAESGGKEQEGGEQLEQQYPDDGLSPKQRAEIKWQSMKEGISKWWSENWPTVILGATAAIGGFIALNIVTGGAITAALPAIMGVVGPLFAGLTILQLAGHVRDYLSKGWEGDIQGGGKSLAKGLAAGAIELISWLTFKAGGAALKGAKALAKGAKTVAKGGINLAKKAAQAVIKGVKYIIEKGKVLFKGIAGSGIGKQFKKLKDLGKGLLERMRFKAFRIRIANRWFRLEGLINPWVVIAQGQVTEVVEGTEGAIKVSEEQLQVLKNLSDEARQVLTKLKQEEVDQLVKLIQQSPRDAEDILKQYSIKVRKGKAEISENVGSKLQDSLDNFERVKQQGHPYGFNKLEEFTNFKQELKSAVARYTVPSDDIRIHGSAVHKLTPGDLDIAIVVDEAKFKELAQRFLVNSNQPKVANSIREGIEKGIIPSRWFAPRNGATVIQSVYGKAGSFEKIQVSLILRGSSFDIGPYLPL
ncbi:MAG TPA: hypothetical protein DDZ80_03360 [Cyanobacteria bacterium UBA8803]|nr:hypothetical protein [Cyanobacteria bacterium UBA8803]